MSEFRSTIARDAVREAFANLEEAIESGDLRLIRKAEKKLSQARRMQRRA